jgi:hypothetical protein
VFAAAFGTRLNHKIPPHRHRQRVEGTPFPGMRLPPESVVATWPAPNFIDPEHRGPALTVVEFTILPLALIFLGLRLYVRACVLRSMGIDDWLMIAAAVSAAEVPWSFRTGNADLSFPAIRSAASA